jgi:3-dehydroquinate synthetase
MANIKVNIKNENIKYEINFTENVILHLKKKIKNIDQKKLLFVFDSNIYKLYYKK